MRRVSRHVALLAALLAPMAAMAQRPERPPRRPPTTRPTDERPTTRPDTARPAGPRVPGDTTAATDSSKKQLVEWAAEDSVMRALRERPGYIVTRYQGDTVVFDAATRALTLTGDPSAVARGEALLVSDTLYYDDSLQVVRARGDTIVLRDPTQSDADLVAGGQMVYYLATRRAVVQNVATAVESGERWYVDARRAAFVDDTLADARIFYGRDGTITSCDHPDPHYHFKAGSLKLVARSVLVARPATLYIADVPVMWLPFMFADLRSGRRSGILPPRLGITDIVRTSPSYRRHIEDLGYYWAINDFMDAQLSFDWRSGVRGGDTDPGWTQYHGQFRYRWLDRFMAGDVATSYQALRGLSRNLNVWWRHSQDFSQDSRLGMDLNYSSNTITRSQTTTNPYAALATIRSSANYTNVIGPLSLNVGGTRTQYPGRTQVDYNFPNLSLSTQGPFELARWLVWTPTLQLNTTGSDRIDQGAAVVFRYLTRPDGTVDSTRLGASQRATSIAISTPLKIFEFNWQNSFSITDRVENFPGDRTVYASAQDSVGEERRFARTFSTGVDWTTGFSLPGVSRGRWNLTPGVNFSNVDPSPFWVRNERTGGQWVHQSKRPSFSLSSSPTFFGLFGGFGPFARFRHSVTPTLSYNYSPRAKVSEEFLLAQGVRRQGYLGALQQSAVSLNIQTGIEGKLRPRVDTGDGEGGQKVKVVSLTFTPLGYDFERYKALRRSADDPDDVSRWAGFNTDRFNYSFRSDLLPGFSLSSRYSLFEGDITSDTSRFKPYREGLDVSFSLGRSSNLINLMSRVFGRSPAPETTPQAGTTTPGLAEDASARQIAAMPVAGTNSRNSQFDMPDISGGWQTSFTFSSTRQRPLRGGNVVTIDLRQECIDKYLGTDRYQPCLFAAANPQVDDTTFGGSTRGSRTFTRSPPRTTLGASTAFHITPKWAAHWSTTYDFEQEEFASHIVSLQRDLHDWRAVFAFTQSPNGNFAFNFFIALKAQPDLKFDYDQRSYRSRSAF